MKSKFVKRLYSLGGDGGGGKSPIVIRGGDMGQGGLILISLLLIFSSCSIKKQQEPEAASYINALDVKTLPDADNDGIPDEVERRNGTNPFLADIPKISIGLVQDISVGAIFKLACLTTI